MNETRCCRCNNFEGRKFSEGKAFFLLNFDIQSFKKINRLHVNYLEKHKILYEFQFGFRKGHSTSQAIAEIADNLRNTIDNNLYSCGVFLDFSKAFDTVNHTILLKKMERYGIRGLPLQLFASYLTNRQQYVQMGNTISSKQTMTEFPRPGIIFNLHKRFTKLFKCSNI